MTEREAFEAWWRDFHTTGFVSQQQYAWLVWQAARAQPAQAVPASCGECGKKTSDGWALYCVACMESAGLPGGTSSPPLTHSCTSSLVRTADSTAQAVPLLSDAEILQLSEDCYQGGYVHPLFNFARAIEQAVRAKCGIVGKEGA